MQKLQNNKFVKMALGIAPNQSSRFVSKT